MKTILAAILSLAACSACAQELTIDWTWKKDHFCNDTSPALAIGNVPTGTKTLQFQMNDLDFQNFDHGGGLVDYAGNDGKMIVPDGALKQYKGPCPRNDFYSFGHDYVIYVKALGADGSALASGNKKQTFSSKTAQ